MDSAARHAIVFRIGALGDVLLTRRLTYSLSLAGIRSTLFAPARHASLLLADPWIETVLDSEAPRFADAFAGVWPEEPRGFEFAVVISASTDLLAAARSAAASVIQVAPQPLRDDLSIGRQWADELNAVCPAFTSDLPSLPTDERRAHFPDAAVIHPGSGSKLKNWPVDRFLNLSIALRQQGHRVVWVRGPAESDFPDDASKYELLDLPSIETLAATLARAKFFVGNDSGVSHLAAAVGVPTLALFGLTSDVVWRPDGRLVQAISSSYRDLTAIPVEDVLTALRPWLGSDDGTV